MKKWERNMKKEEFKYERNIPSFSSSLLDEIYRSIDDGEKKTGDELKFYRKTETVKKQVKIRAFEEAEMVNLRRACVIEKWNRRQELYRKTHFDYDHDRDVLFFSSNSNSSDSSSGGFSSSDTESMFGFGFGTRSCFAPSKPKPIRTEKAERKQRTLFSKKNEHQLFDEMRQYNSASESQTPKTKSSNLKKLKQPISPGGRLAGLLNSLFTVGNSKKTKSSMEIDKKLRSGEESTCSSASSFTRSCLSKYSASSRERMGDEVKRTVRFCPISVIVDEDCRPCGHKGLYEDDGSSLMPVSIPKAWKIGRFPTRKTEEKDGKFSLVEKSKKVEDVAREILKKKNLKARELIQSYKDFREEVNDSNGDGDDDDDDGASCSSSDLFELDHLELIGRRQYSQELPVYETTHVEKNRAIAKGLLMQS